MKDKDLDRHETAQFVFPVNVLETHIDSFNHVNNAHYLKWMDDCARAHSLVLGVDCDNANDLGFGMAVRESRTVYLASAYLNDEISVSTWIASNDSKLRITREFRIIRDRDKMTLVSAQIDYVCINIRTGKPSRMPELFQRCYQAL